MPIQSNLNATTLTTGVLSVEWNPNSPEGARLTIRVGQDIIWESVPKEAFLCTTQGHSNVKETRGFFTIRDSRPPFTEEQTLEEIQLIEDAIVLTGTLNGRTSVPWKVSLKVLDPEQILFTATLENPAKEPRLLLRYSCQPDERFFGFGEQFTHLDLKGRRLDILSQEPGIGRGIQPLTWLMNRFGAGGDDTRSNAPVPHYITSACRSLCLENHELSRFDLRAEEQVEIELWSDTLVARLFHGDTPESLIQSYTRFCGRMPPLPAWLQNGAIIGMQGGTAAVRKRLRRLEDVGAPISAFWLQDWIGVRKTSAGSQLWWNWELDPAALGEPLDLLTAKPNGTKAKPYQQLIATNF